MGHPPRGGSQVTGPAASRLRVALTRIRDYPLPAEVDGAIDLDQEDYWRLAAAALDVVAEAELKPDSGPEDVPAGRFVFRGDGSDIPLAKRTPPLSARPDLEIKG